MTLPAPSRSPVRDILSVLRGLSVRERVSLGDLVERVGPSSFVPALLVPALLVVSPLSGIPLFSSVCGLAIALIAAQMLLRRRQVWLPRALLSRGVPGARLAQAVDWMDGPASWLDRRLRHRMGALFVMPFASLLPLACIAAGLAMPFLEFVPFSSSILGTAVVCIAVGILARDGLWAFAGAAFMVLAAVIPSLVLFRFA
jgi:hypothetical protein